jgi:hypothetical protein
MGTNGQWCREQKAGKGLGLRVNQWKQCKRMVTGGLEMGLARREVNVYMYRR